MKIYFNPEALVQYLSEFREIIRGDNDRDSFSIFNNEPQFFTTDMTLAKQELIFVVKHQRIPQDDKTDSSKKEQDLDFPSDGSRKGDFKKQDLIIDGLKDELKKVNEDITDQEIQDFIADFKAWYLFQDKKVSLVPEELLGKESNPYDKESALYLFHTNGANHCPYSIITHNNILKNLAKRFFVDFDKSYLNKTMYTRSFKDWSPISEPMQYETDIIIVDAYLFEGLGDTFGQNAESLIRAICGKGKKEQKNVVLFFENTYPLCWLHDFYLRIITNDVNCNITFVSVPDNIKKLHDRYIVSNHRLIFSGHSFSLYFNGGRFSANGSIWLSIGSSADENNQEVIKEALHYLQTEVLGSGEVCIYGKEKRLISKLLSASGDSVNMRTFGEITMIYEFQTEIKPQWDGEVWHWNDIQIAAKGDKNYFKGESVRLVNIKENTDPEKNGKYKLFAKYKPLKNR